MFQFTWYSFILALKYRTQKEKYLRNHQIKNFLHNILHNRCHIRRDFSKSFLTIDDFISNLISGTKTPKNIPDSLIYYFFQNDQIIV